MNAVEVKSLRKSMVNEEGGDKSCCQLGWKGTKRDRGVGEVEKGEGEEEEESR